MSAVRLAMLIDALDQYVQSCEDCEGDPDAPVPYPDEARALLDELNGVHAYAADNATVEVAS